MEDPKFKEDVQKAIKFVKRVVEKDGPKALRSMARALVGACYETGIDVSEYMKNYEDDTIFSPGCLLLHNSNIFDYYSEEYVVFAKCMFELRPVGLGTPNAMVGEGEFLVIFSSPSVRISKGKDEGDLLVLDEGKQYKVELKGSYVRLFGELKGKEFHQKVIEIASDYEITPNTCKGNRIGFEPWGLSKKQHWLDEFQRIGQDTAIVFLTKVVQILDPETQFADLNICFDGERFIPENLLKIMLKIFFAKQRRHWDYFTIISDERIRCLSSSYEDFNHLVEIDEIIVTGNYIRIFQDIKIGLYFNFKPLI